MEELQTNTSATEYQSVEQYVAESQSVDITITEHTQQTFILDYRTIPQDVDIHFRVQKEAQLMVYERGEGVQSQNGTISVHLEASGAGVVYEARWRTQNEEQHQLAHYILHEASYTTSRLNTKAVLKDYSFINYDDRIRVELGARQCRGEQHLEALLFSERAKLHTIPNLEIHNQEVQSKHGVSIRYLNPEWVFYLQSRGIGWEDACDLIEEGFLAFPEPKKFTA